MSRESLCHDWQSALAHCESCAAAAPVRYQWLYQVRARIYRVLLAMYGGKQAEDWNLPAPADEELSPVYVADSVEVVDGELSGSPPKSKGVILKALKNISSANETVPRGNFTCEEVLLHPQIVANVSKRKDFVCVFTALEGAQIHYTYRRQGVGYQFLVAPEDVEDAVKVITESLTEMDRESRLCLSPRDRFGDANAILIMGALLSFGVAVMLLIGYWTTEFATFDEFAGPVALAIIAGASLSGAVYVRTLNSRPSEDP